MTEIQTSNAPTYDGQQLKPHRGGAILALGILGLLVCVICGIVAWVMANSDLEEMDRGLMDPAGRENTKTGKILGIISVAIMGAGLVVMVIVLIIAIVVPLVLSSGASA